MDAYEQVAQMGDEPADVDAVLIKRDAVGLLDDGQHLLDDAGHLVCVGQVAGSRSRALTRCNANATASLPGRTPFR